MTPEEIKNRVSALLESDRISTAEIAVIDKMYYEVFRRNVRDCNCPNRYRDALIEIAIYIKNHPTMEKSTYILKAGVVIQPSGTSEVYTNTNLTDAVAEQFLKERPGAVGLFEVIPGRPGTESPANAPETGKKDEPDARVAELEAEVESLKVENENLKGELAKMTEYRDRAVHDLDEILAKAEAAGLIHSHEPGKESEQEPAEGDDADKGADKEPENKDAGTVPAGLNPEILAAIKARLENGETKSAIIADYVGMEVDGKALTKYGVEKYFAAIKNA